MSLKAITPFTPEWFTPASEKDEATPTRFKIQGMTGSQQADVAPGVEVVEYGFELSGASMALTLRYGLLGWENFSNKNGPVEFSENAPALNQDVIPYKLQREITREIFLITYATAEHKKKSKSRAKS